MKKTALLLAMVLSLVILLSGGCNRQETEEKLIVVTSTSLMEYIVQQVGGSHVEVINLIPPNQHPGNFDAKPSDIEKLVKADLFLLHGWPGEAYADNLIASANNPDMIVNKVSVDGNWMIPSVQMAAVDKVAGFLSEVDTKNTSTYQAFAQQYKQRIQAKESDIKARLSEADVTEIRVIASFRQADFLKWTGFNVVATFGGTVSLTPQVIRDLVDQGKAENVVLVVNNIQDGLDAGIAIAEELKAQNLNLSNFPGGYLDTLSWEKAIEKNVTILLDAVAKVRADGN